MSIAEQDPNAAKVARETAGTDKPRRWLGKSLNRVEDPRFLRGQGRYLDDIKLPGMLHAAVLGSPHAHARIVSIDTSKAEALARASSASSPARTSPSTRRRCRRSAPARSCRT